MATFIYRAKNFEGKTISGDTEGDSKEQVIARLREKGFFVLSIEKKKGGFSFSFGGGSVSSRDVSIFAQMFSVMMGSGVPLVRCLSILQGQTENPAFHKVIGQVRSDVEGGATLSNALAKHPRVFDTLFVNLVKAGEAGGILDGILKRMASYLESSEALKAKVKGALTYPVVILSIAGLVVLALIMFVLPQFKSIFSSMNVELPFITQILLTTSDVLIAWWFVIVPSLFLVPIGISEFFKTERGARLYDINILRVPAFGPMMKKMAVARFTRTLGTMITSGVPILQALEVTAATAGNSVIKDAVDSTRASIREGESIAEPLKQSNVFPAMVVQMIAVGEETGELDKMLMKIADFYEVEVDNAVKGLTSIIEPIVIVFMGVVIGGIVLAVFMPMLSLVNGT
ncbi:MAG: type II secretion system F family protein [Candidatus Cloacimonetes bacterium]|nr:type II secretion system F family protein [Candidatus Cloacimonadota bacterium]